METDHYVDTLDNNKVDECKETKFSLIKHSKLDTTKKETEMDIHHDYEEIEVTRRSFETTQQNNGLNRLKRMICCMAVMIFVIFATVISLAVIFYLQKTPDNIEMSAFSVNTPYSYNSFNGSSRLAFANIIYQHGQDFNLSAGTFTCSIPGIYHFSVNMARKRQGKITNTIHCKINKSIFKDNKDKFLSVIRIADTGCTSVSQTFVIDLDIGDSVYLGTCYGVENNLHLEWWSSFTGFLLYPQTL